MLIQNTLSYLVNNKSSSNRIDRKLSDQQFLKITICFTITNMASLWYISLQRARTRTHTHTNARTLFSCIPYTGNKRDVSRKTKVVSKTIPDFGLRQQKQPAYPVFIVQFLSRYSQQALTWEIRYNNNTEGAFLLLLHVPHLAS